MNHLTYRPKSGPEVDHDTISDKSDEYEGMMKNMILEFLIRRFMAIDVMLCF